MFGIVGIVALLTVLFLSLLITRLASVALRLTGLSSEAARFQARSAFTGTGFTTSEAEKVVDHPVRRRVIMLLMITRSAGLITIIISLILSFANTTDEQTMLIRFAWMGGGMAVLWILSSSKWLERGMNRIMEWALRRWTDLDTIDYSGLLNLEGEYSVKKIVLQENDWLVGKALEECKLFEEGVTILGIYRKDNHFLGAPKSSTELYEGDTLVLYGRGKRLQELSKRQSDPEGEAAHREAVSDQEAHEQEQDRQEAEHKQNQKK